MPEPLALSALPAPDAGMAWRTETAQGNDGRGVFASVALHGALLVALAFWRASVIVAPAEQPVEVVLLSPADFAAPDAPTRVAPLEPAPSAPTRVAPLEPAPSAPPNAPSEARGMIRPTVMLSAAALADPKSAQGRKEYESLNPTERMVQLCDLEAMEQVKAWRPSFHPERVVAYTTGTVKITGRRIEAETAAIRSDGDWYRLSFACTLSGDGANVTGFAFRVGGIIPRADEERLNLRVGEAD